MKNILLGSAALIILAIAVTIVQTSCQKINAQQNRPTSPTAAGSILFLKRFPHMTNPITHSYVDSTTGNTVVVTDGVDTIYNWNFYTCDIDGSNQQQIPINLPAGLHTEYGNAHLAGNGTSVVFLVSSDYTFTFGSNGSISYSYLNLSGAGIYSCGIDGSNLTQIIPHSASLYPYTILADGY